MSFRPAGPAGKAELYARIMDGFPEEVRRPDFQEAIKELDRQHCRGNRADEVVGVPGAAARTGPDPPTPLVEKLSRNDEVLDRPL